MTRNIDICFLVIFWFFFSTVTVFYFTTCLAKEKRSVFLISNFWSHNLSLINIFESYSNQKVLYPSQRPERYNYPQPSKKTKKEKLWNMAMQWLKILSKKKKKRVVLCCATMTYSKSISTLVLLLLLWNFCVLSFRLKKNRIHKQYNKKHNNNNDESVVKIVHQNIDYWQKIFE